MTYTANDFPLPIVIQNFQQNANLSAFDLNFDTLSSHLANVANIAYGGGGGGGEGGTNSAIIVSDTPPVTGLKDGLLWWNSTRGVLKVYYNSGQSQQWVDATTATGGGLSQATLTYIHGVVATAQGATASELSQLQTNYTTLYSTVQGIQTTVITGATMTEVNQAISDASQSLTINYENYVSNYVLQHPSSQGTIIDLSSYATINFVNTTLASAQGAFAEQYSALGAQFTSLGQTVQGVQTIADSKATIYQVNQVLATAQGAVAQQYNGLSSQFTLLQQNLQGVQTIADSKATIDQVNSAVATAQGAVAQQYNTLSANFTSLQQTVQGVQVIADSKATISEALSAVAGAGYASASILNTLQSTVAGQTTTVSTLTSSVNGIQGRYGVTIDNNNSVSGFQLLSGVGGSSEFSVTADKFKINKTGAAQALTVFNLDTVTNKLSLTANVDISGSLTVTAPQVSSAINGGATSGARIEMDATNGGRIKIYDSGGNLRVQLGYLG